MQTANTTNPSTSTNNSASKTDRKTREKNRRNHMKVLYTQLNSLIPDHNQGSSSSRDQQTTPLPDQVDEAIEYIKNLQEKLEELKRKKDKLQRSRSKTNVGYKSPKIAVQERDYAVEVILITGLECQFIFSEAIRILHEEATEVVNATFNVVQGTVYHTIHAKTGEVAPSYKAARITERLQKFTIDP